MPKGNGNKKAGELVFSEKTATGGGGGDEGCKFGKGPLDNGGGKKCLPQRQTWGARAKLEVLLEGSGLVKGLVLGNSPEIRSHISVIFFQHIRLYFPLTNTI